MSSMPHAAAIAAGRPVVYITLTDEEFNARLADAAAAGIARYAEQNAPKDQWVGREAAMKAARRTSDVGFLTYLKDHKLTKEGTHWRKAGKAKEYNLRHFTK